MSKSGKKIRIITMKNLIDTSKENSIKDDVIISRLNI